VDQHRSACARVHRHLRRRAGAAHAQPTTRTAPRAPHDVPAAGARGVRALRLRLPRQDRHRPPHVPLLPLWRRPRRNPPRPCRQRRQPAQLQQPGRARRRVGGAGLGERVSDPARTRAHRGRVATPDGDRRHPGRHARRARSSATLGGCPRALAQAAAGRLRGRSADARGADPSRGAHPRAGAPRAADGSRGRYQGHRRRHGALRRRTAGRLRDAGKRRARTARLVRTATVDPHARGANRDRRREGDRRLPPASAWPRAVTRRATKRCRRRGDLAIGSTAPRFAKIAKKRLALFAVLGVLA
jgi:hypothetical protein